jgi:CRISPR-associated protein Csb1
MFEALQSETRLLLKANLSPVQGLRFQPLASPTWVLLRFNRGKDLIVESAQSVANRLEVAIWDELNQDVVQPLQGIPYVVVKDKDGSMMTNSSWSPIGSTPTTLQNPMIRNSLTSSNRS